MDTAPHQTPGFLSMDIWMPSMISFSCFVLLILKQFGELSKHLEQTRRDASFRATEIKKSPDKGEDATPSPGNEGIGNNSAILDFENLGEHLCTKQLSCSPTQQRQIVGETHGLCSI